MRSVNFSRGRRSARKAARLEASGHQIAVHGGQTHRAGFETIEEGIELLFCTLCRYLRQNLSR